MTAYSHAVTSVGTDGGALHLSERQSAAHHRNGAGRPNASLSRLTPARQVPRVINEYAQDVARRLMRTKAFLKSRDERNGGLQYLTAGAGIPSVIPRSATLPYRPTAQSAKSSSSVPRLGNAKFR
jgi:hypothetical protein